MINVRATYHKVTTIQNSKGRPKEKIWFKDTVIKKPNEADIYIGSALVNKSKTMNLIKLVENRRYRFKVDRIDKFNDFFPKMINPRKLMPHH